MPFHFFLQHWSYPSCPLNCSLNGIDLLSQDEKGGSIPLSTYPGFNTLVYLPWVQYPCPPTLGSLPLSTYPGFNTLVHLPWVQYPCPPTLCSLPLSTYPVFTTLVYLPWVQYPCPPTLGSIPLSTYLGFNTLVHLPCYIFKAANIHGVQYPFGLNLDEPIVGFTILI